ncbi:aldo/keto reductase [Sphingosinicella terrae]|uniref:aldo/keto reductase n=1 Tax=Sphingosinicella terrae TaxID=2172047 RepID=UPI000E0DB2BC|nr:aldo/keto reductase [Sphingosinicella terrae]
MDSRRKVGPFEVGPIGLGCMSLSHAYGTPPDPEQAGRLLNAALDLGYDFIDSAALYGFGANEALIGEAIGHRRGDYVLASKCGMTGVDGKRVIDGRPETLLRTVDESLRRLKTETIDLYYLHRWDKEVPVEESVGALGRMVEEGKVRAIGLSEVSAETLRKAHGVHPIAAVQNEYSPWSRNVELGVLAATRELGAALVTFSPMARGFLAGSVRSADQLEANDLRRTMPRFQGENLERNLRLYARFEALAGEAGCTPAQLSLAWLLSRGEHVIPIPGTTSLKHLEENLAAGTLAVSAYALAEIDGFMTPEAIAGARYAEATLAEIDTEDFA